MSAVGETLRLPTTAKTPLMVEMVTEVAPVVVQLSVTGSPSMIEFLEAEKESTRGLTLTLAVSVALSVALSPSRAVSV